jgi:flagellar hook-length control protein FliK
MPTAVIDTLLQTVAAARPAEPPPRPGDGRGAFRPALDDALRGDALRGGGAPTPTICPPPPVERPADADKETIPDRQPDDQHGDATAETTVADPADDSAAKQAVAADEADDDDAVEISEDAATEASAAAAAAAAIVASGEHASATAKPTSPAGDAEIASLGGGKKTGGQRPEHLASKSAADADAKTNGASLQAEAAETAGDPFTKTAAQSSSNKSGASAEGESSADHGASRAAVATIDGLANDADDSPSGDSAGRDARRAAGSARLADAPQPAVADGNAKPPANNGEPAPPGPPVAAAPPVVAHRAPEPAAARVAASIARFAAGRPVHDAASQSDETGQLDRARFVGRVEGAIRTAQQRDGRVHVRLSPPELGSLRIELTMHNGALSAHLEAETPAARHLLLDNLPALRDRLAQQDIRVDRFDVDVRSDGGGSNQQQNAQDRPAGDPTAGQRDERRGRPAVRTAPPTRGPLGGSGPTNANAALDVRV